MQNESKFPDLLTERPKDMDYVDYRIKQKEQQLKLRKYLKGRMIWASGGVNPPTPEDMIKGYYDWEIEPMKTFMGKTKTLKEFTSKINDAKFKENALHQMARLKERLDNEQQ